MKTESECAMLGYDKGDGVGRLKNVDVEETGEKGRSSWVVFKYTDERTRGMWRLL